MSTAAERQARFRQRQKERVEALKTENQVLRDASAAARLASAQAGLEDASRQIAELEGRRDAALLGDDDAQADTLADEVEVLQRAARTLRDKIKILTREAEREERERVAREKLAKVEAIEKKLAARDKAGAELVAVLKEADRLFLRLVDLGRDIAGAFPWQGHDLAPILLGPPAIRTAIESELYRLTGRPFLGGGQKEHRHAGLSFPGARCPDIRLIDLPQRLTPFTDALAQATALASRILRNGVSTSDVEPTIVVPTAAAQPMTTNGGTAPAATVSHDTVDVQTSEQPASQPLSAAQEKLRDLNTQLMRASEDMSEAGEKRYAALLEQVAAANEAVHKGA